jgi:hypothetical protein
MGYKLSLISAKIEEELIIQGQIIVVEVYISSQNNIVIKCLHDTEFTGHCKFTSKAYNVGDTLSDLEVFKVLERGNIGALPLITSFGFISWNNEIVPGQKEVDREVALKAT